MFFYEADKTSSFQQRLESSPPIHDQSMVIHRWMFGHLEKGTFRLRRLSPGCGRVFGLMREGLNLEDSRIGAAFVTFYYWEALGCWSL